MSGHSHWASIKHKKGAADAKKGKIFSKLVKNIIMAARSGGDPDTNTSLRLAIDKAKQASMPKNNIERAVKRGTGEIQEGGTIEQLLYEGYGPGGVALMVDIITDNRNRTSSEIRKIFDSRGGSLGESGCVSWMFEKKGILTIEKSAIGEDELMEAVLECGAENMNVVGDVYEITTAPTDFETVKTALEGRNLKFIVAEITKLPKNTVNLDENTGRKILTLIECLEEHEDVQNVYGNYEIPESLVGELEK